MANVRIKNVSKRPFVVGDGEGGEIRLEIGKVVELGKAEADRLLEIYPGELVDVATQVETPVNAPKAPGAEADAIEAMTVVDLRKALKAKGVEFPAAAPKAELVALLKGANGAAPAAPGTLAVPTTALTGPDQVFVEGTVYEDDQGKYVGAPTTANGKTVIGLLPVTSLTPEERAKLVAEGKLPA